MRGFIVGTAITAIAFFILTQVLPKYTPFDLITYKGDPIGLVVLAVIFGIVNGLVGPIVRTLALPLSFMTLGLIGFVINGGLLLITAWIGNTVAAEMVPNPAAVRPAANPRWSGNHLSALPMHAP